MTFEMVLKLKQEVLLEALRKHFKKAKPIKKRGAFLLVKGSAPVLLVAHLDTVHREHVKDICYSSDKDLIMSPQGIGGDDRCGVWALLEVYKHAKTKPYLLFTCDEEVGGVGADKFVDYLNNNLDLIDELGSLKFFIEIDRKGKDDAVYYECANDDFEKYITGHGYKTDWGSFSDISVIAPELGVAAVNLSSGYYNAHTQFEYIVFSELQDTINKVVDMVNESVCEDIPHFEYVDAWGKVDSKYNYDDYYEDVYLYLRGRGYERNFLDELKPDELEELYYDEYERECQEQQHGGDMYESFYWV